MRTIYWDTGSLFLYLIEAFIGMVCLTHVCRANKGTSISTKSYLPYAITFIFTWGLFAAFRHVSNGIGGADAIDYVDFFKGCWGNMDAHMEHTASDVLYLYLNRFVRLFTSSYQIFFIIVYGFIAASILQFVKRFGSAFVNTIPLFLVFYLYLRGYNTLRSLLCISFILLGVIGVLDKKYKKAYILMICAALTHKMGIVYGLVMPFLHIAINKGIKVKYLIIGAILISFLGIYIRDYFIQFAYFYDLGGAYGSYANEAKEANNYMAGATECFFQYLLALMLILFNKQLKNLARIIPSGFQKPLLILSYICYFDFLLMPLNVLFGIWRGFEFFYIPRLLMWGWIIYYFARKLRIKTPLLVNTFVFIIVVAWFIFRVSRNYEAAALMPYSLDLF